MSLTSTDAIKTFLEAEPDDEKQKYVFIVNELKLFEQIYNADYYAVLIQNEAELDEFKQIVVTALTKGGYVKERTFLFVQIKKNLAESLKAELQADGVPFDRKAYLMFKDRNTAYLTDDEVKNAIDQYIKSHIERGKATTKIVCLNEIGIEKVDWLWWPYIPKGKLTIMQGDPGGGKTYSMLKIVAELSRGGSLPGDRLKRNPIKVLYQTAEDGYKDTINYRLKKMDADLNNIYMLDESEKTLSFMDERLENFLNECKPGLMVFDPIQAYLGSGIDMHRANEVRPIMSHIIKLAEEYKCALVVITHMSKMTQASALYRNLGSIDITAAARSVLVVGKDPKDAETKIIAQVKSSTAKNGKSIAFKINDVSGVEWNGYSDLEADDILDSRRERKKKEPVSLEEAERFLIETLGNKEYERLELIKTKAEEAGIAERTLYNAKNELNIVSHSIGYGKNKIAWWSMNDIKKEDLPHEPQQTKLTDLPIS